MTIVMPRCGNCGRFAEVQYEWRGPSYTEVVDCDNCGKKAYEYDAWAAAISASDSEVMAHE